MDTASYCPWGWRPWGTGVDSSNWFPSLWEEPWEPTLSFAKGLFSGFLVKNQGSIDLRQNQRTILPSSLFSNSILIVFSNYLMWIRLSLIFHNSHSLRFPHLFCFKMLWKLFSIFYPRTLKYRILRNNSLINKFNTLFLFPQLIHSYELLKIYL